MLSKNQVNTLSTVDLAALCSKGSQARKRQISKVTAKPAVFAILRSTPSWWRNRAASTELSMPFGLKVGAVLAKRQGDRKRGWKCLIVEAAVGYSGNSRAISQIGDAFRVQNSGPGLIDLHRRRGGNCGRLPKPLEEVRE